MKIHQLTVADAFASLKSGVSGLGDDEAARRLAEFGPNEVEDSHAKPLILTFCQGVRTLVRDHFVGRRGACILCRVARSGAWHGLRWESAIIGVIVHQRRVFRFGSRIVPSRR